MGFGLSDPRYQNRSCQPDRVHELWLCRFTGLALRDSDRDFLDPEVVFAGFDDQLGGTKPFFGQRKLSEFGPPNRAIAVGTVRDRGLRQRVDQPREKPDPDPPEPTVL